MKRAKKKKYAPSGFVGPSPFLSPEIQKVWWQAFGFLTLFDTIKGGFSPGPLDPKAWYDRAIRIVGGILILLVLTAGIVLLVRERIAGSK